MRLPRHQQRLLRQMRRTLRGTDPHLCSMLVIFAKLTAGEEMPAREQTPRRIPAAARALASLISAVACLAGRVLLACGRAGRHAAMRSLAACTFLRTRFRPAPALPGATRRNQ